MNDSASSWRSPVVLTALAATLTLGLAACSGTDSGAATTPPSASSSEVTESSASAGSESRGSVSSDSVSSSSESSTSASSSSEPSSSESSSAAPTSSSASSTSSSASSTSSATSTSPVSSGSRTSTSRTTTTGTDGTGTAGPLLGAAALALRAVPGSVVSSVETEQGGWEVKVIDQDGNEYEGRTDAAGTALVGTPSIKKEDAAGRAKHRDRIAAASVDHQQAVGIIGRSTPGTITELGLDDYRGTTVWEADVQTAGGTKVSVKIDAAQGAEVTRSAG